MKEKILDKVFQKVSEVFDKKFLPRAKFEQALEKISPNFIDKFEALKSEYEDAVASSDISKKYSLARISKEDFIEERCTSNYRSTDDSNAFMMYGDQYDGLLSKSDATVTLYFTEWLIRNKERLLDFNCDESVKKYLSDMITPYSHLNTAKEILKTLEDNYKVTFGPYMSLLEMSDKYLSREELPSFSSWVVNVGKDYLPGRSLNTYEYVKIVVLSTGKNELLVLEIVKDNLKRKSIYHISKDIQKVDIINGNTVVTHMHKHFEPERIVFETEEEAFQFHQKVSDSRVRKNYPERKRN